MLDETHSLHIIIGVIVGIKIAIFLTLFFYSIMVNFAIRKKSANWINLISLSFIVIAITEFLYWMSQLETQYSNIFPWLLEEQNFEFLTNLLFLIAGIGLLLFLRDINKNIKDFR